MCFYCVETGERDTGCRSDKAKSAMHIQWSSLARVGYCNGLRRREPSRHRRETKKWGQKDGPLRDHGSIESPRQSESARRGCRCERMFSWRKLSLCVWPDRWERSSTFFEARLKSDLTRECYSNTRCLRQCYGAASEPIRLSGFNRAEEQQFDKFRMRFGNFGLNLRG